MKTGKLLLVQLCLLLVACQGGQGDDLDQFIANAEKDMRVKIDPLPEVLPYTPMEYNADGSLVNPFKARKAIADSASKLQPDMNRPREPLEAYPLESLTFVGSMEKQKQTPDNSVQQVKIGNYMGQNFGMVTDVLESGVVLKEIVRDDLSGDWVERTANVDLQD